jgi:hypothetical protein
MTYPDDSLPTERHGWFANWSPNKQITYGCIAIILLGASVMYCVGTISFVARPWFVNRETPTELVRPTLVPTLTSVIPTIIILPPGKLVATPTQGRVPTRESPTVTPTVDLTNPAPTGTITVTRGTTTPTRRLSATPTTKP